MVGLKGGRAGLFPYMLYMLDLFNGKANKHRISKGVLRGKT